MNATEVITSTALVLGHDGDWWDFWMLTSLVIVGLAALAAAALTTGSVLVHKREAFEASRALEQYKLDTANKVADATKAGLAAGEIAGHAQADIDGAQAEIATQKRLTAEAQRAANEANSKAESFRADIAKAEEGSARAQAQVAGAAAAAAEAGAKAEGFRRDIATANEGAAQAVARSESERLARIKLEAIIAPRRLDGEQSRLIAAELSPFIGKRIVIASYAFDTDGIILAGQIEKAVIAAGIFVTDEIGAHIPAHAPILEGVRVTGTEDSLVSALKTALETSDIEVDKKLIPLPQELLVFLDGPKDAVATVYVGAKPLAGTDAGK